MASRPKYEYQKVKNEVFEKLKKDDSVDYKKLKSDPAGLQRVEKEMKKAYDELTHMMSHADSFDDALGHLSPDRRQMIKTTFRLQSFNVDIQHQSDGTVNLLFASLSGSGLSFVPSVVKMNRGNLEENRVLLAARIIFEVIVLVLNLICLAVSPSSKATAETIGIISSVLASHGNIFGDLDKMVAAAEKKDMKGVALAIVACLVDLFKPVGTPLLGIVKILLQDMSWIDIIIAVAQVLCYVATIILSAGAAMVAKVISWLLSATSFIMKLSQMKTFKSIQLSE